MKTLMECIWRFSALMAVTVCVTVAACSNQDPLLGIGNGIAVLAPSVTAVTPLANATGVPTNTRTLTAAFNKTMNPASLTAASFTVACPATTRTGVVSYVPAGNVATLTLAADLPASTLCNATITTGAQDTTGNALTAPFTWSFRTAASPDAIAPTVTSTAPVSGAVGVAINSLVTAIFSEPMNPLTITAASFTLACPAGTPVAGTVAYAVNARTATFTPAANLPASTACTATISTGSRDVAGNALAAPFIWTFTTGTVPDTVAPTVISGNPANTASGICTNKTVNITFSEAMDPLTINAAAGVNVAMRLAAS